MENLIKKIKILIFASFSLFISVQLTAQGAARGYLYVSPSHQSAYPNAQGGISNSILQSFFQLYGVVSYVKSFPGAQSQELQNIYEIHLNGNETALSTELKASGLFSSVEIEQYMEMVANPVLDCPILCSNPATVNDPYSGYELTLPGYPCAWGITQGDPSVVIAVVDADFDLNHPDLSGNIISKVGTPGSPECGWHGNAVAGAIIATPNNGIDVAGAAPGAKVAGYIVDSQFLANCGCKGNPWPQVWKAYLDGRRIINVSWSGMEQGTSGVPVVAAIKEMTENGTLLILAAGNGQPGDFNHWEYSNIPGVINVSSISSDGTLHQWVTYNQYVDLCAPGNGVGIVSSEYTCDGTTSIVHNAYGTSQSAPNVAASAALILSVNPCLTPSEIRVVAM